MTASRLGLSREQVLTMMQEQRRRKAAEERDYFLEEYAYLRSWNMPLAEVARHLGIERDSLITRLRRYGVRP